MAENVIRQDVVQIGFDIDDSGFSDLNNDIKEMVSKVSGVTDNVSEDMKGISDNAKEASKSVAGITDEAKKMKDSGADGLKETIGDTSEEAKECEVRLSSMVKALASSVTGKVTKLPKLIQSSASAARNFASSLRANMFNGPKKGATALKKQIEKIKNIKISNIADGLKKGLTSSTTAAKNLGKNILNSIDKGLGKAVMKAKELPKNLKASVVTGLSSGVSKLKAKFVEAVKSAKGIKTEADGSANALNKCKEAASGVSSALMKVAGAVGIGFGVSQAIEGVANLQQATNKFQAQTGASEKEMEQYSKIIKSLYGDAMGESLGEVSNTVALVNQQFKGLDANSIKSISKNVLTLSDTFDMDMNESLRGVNALMTNMGLTADQAFDYIAKGAQNGLNKSGELTDNIAEYSQIWGQAGFSAEEMFTILQNGLDSGAYNLDKVNDFVKEFSISLSDGRIEENLSSFSKGTQDLFKQWQNGEASQKDVFNSIINDLGSMTNEQEALSLASTVWSSLGEDNAMAVITSLNNTNDTYKDVKGTMDEINNIRYDDVGSALEALKRQGELALNTALTPILNKVLELIGKFQEWAQEVGLVDKIRSAFEWLKETVSPIVDKVKEVATAIFDFATSEETITTVKNLFDDVKTAVEPIVDAVGKVVDKIVGLDGEKSVLEGIRDVFQTIGDNLNWIVPLVVGITAAFAAYKAIMIAVKVAQIAYNVVMGITNAIMMASPITWIVLAIVALIAIIVVCIVYWDKIKAALSAFFSYFKEGWANIGDWFKNIWNAIATFFTGVWNGIKSVVSTVVTAIMTVITTIFTAIKTFITNVVTGWQIIITTVWNAIKTAISTVITAIQLVITTIWNAITTYISTVINVWQTIITTVWNAIKTAVSTVVNAIKTVITTVWNAISTTISSVLNGIKSVVTSVWNTIKSAISTAVNSIKTTVTSVFNSIKSGISNTISGIYTTIKSGFDNAVSYITGLASEAWQWGADIINGIVDGIKNCVGNITGAVSGVADTIASWLHFSVPDVGPLTDYESWMPDFMSGLAKGIKNSSGLIRNAVAGVAEELVIAPDVRAVGSTATSGVSSAIAIPRNGSAGISGNGMVTRSTSNSSETNNYSPTFVVNMNGASADDTNKRKLKVWMKEVLKEVFDDLDNDNPPEWEV